MIRRMENGSTIIIHIMNIGALIVVNPTYLTLHSIHIVRLSMILNGPPITIHLGHWRRSREIRDDHEYKLNI